MTILNKIYSAMIAIIMILLLIIASVFFIRQQTQENVHDELNSRLGKMVKLRTEAIDRTGLLKMAIQTDNKPEYPQAVKNYLSIRIHYNVCLAGIIAQLELGNKVTPTQINCLPQLSSLDNSDPTGIKKTEYQFFTATQELISGKLVITSTQTEPHHDTDNENKPLSPLDWYNIFEKVSHDRFEQELKRLEIRKSQSDIVNLLESLKWPDIGMIRPQLIARTGDSSSNTKQPKEENKPFDWCKGKRRTLQKFIDTDSEDYITNKTLRILISKLKDEEACK